MDLHFDADLIWHGGQSDVYIIPTLPVLSSLITSIPSPFRFSCILASALRAIQDRKVAFAVQPLTPIFATTCPLSTNSFTITVKIIPPHVSYLQHPGFASAIDELDVALCEQALTFNCSASAAKM